MDVWVCVCVCVFVNTFPCALKICEKAERKKSDEIKQAKANLIGIFSEICIYRRIMYILFMPAFVVYLTFLLYPKRKAHNHILYIELYA